MFRLLFLLLFGVGVFFVLINVFPKTTFQETPQTQIAKDFFLEELAKNISLPPPLRGPQEPKESLLTKEGVLYWTNIQRIEEGLIPLKENDKLRLAANEKLEDMFLNQYFAHISPSGKGVKDFAKEAGYEFISVGENLALGNYADDKELVQAWMASPGHRANILKGSYREIGVALKKGVFEGKSTWLAVQIFGAPISLCPRPEPILKTQIEDFEAQLSTLEKELATLREEIDSMRPKRGSEYTSKVESYNILVDQYNRLVGETKTLIDSYNTQVKTFNECVATHS